MRTNLRVKKAEERCIQSHEPIIHYCQSGKSPKDASVMTQC